MKAFTNRARQEYDEFFLPKNKKKSADQTLPATPSPVPTYAKNDNHDAYLYHRWNRNNRNKKNTSSTTKPTITPVSPLLPIKQPMHPSYKSRMIYPSRPHLRPFVPLTPAWTKFIYSNTDAILNITIWNQPIVQYRMPIQPNTRNRSRHPSTAVRYALIDVYDKLNPSELPCLLPFFTSIICVVLSCFILLADSFTMVKIDDRYPDEWND